MKYYLLLQMIVITKYIYIYIYIYKYIVLIRLII